MPKGPKSMQLGTRPKAQVDAGFESETRGFADAGVSVARIADAGITDAGIADAGFALQEWQTRE